MVTVREKVLIETYKKMLNKKMISIGDIDDLMDAVDKLIQNYQQTVESRDKLKLQVKDLKDQLREFKDVK